jgi:hypothetical protein
MNKVELVARVLCRRSGIDPDGLEPGNICIQTDMQESRALNGSYDRLFDDGTIATDGNNGKDECHFNWREYIFTAQAVLRAIENYEKNEQST